MTFIFILMLNLIVKFVLKFAIFEKKQRIFAAVEKK